MENIDPQQTEDSGVNMLNLAMKNKTGRDLDTANILEPFIREKIFPGVIHVFKDTPKLFLVNGPVYAKIKENLTIDKVQSQNAFLISATQGQWEMYLDKLYTDVLSNKVISKLFNSKRSNMYGAMKYKFQSKQILCIHPELPTQITTNSCDNSNSVGQRMPQC